MMDEERMLRFTGNVMMFMDQQTTAQFYYGLAFAAITAYLGMIGGIVVVNPYDYRTLVFSPLGVLALVFYVCGLRQRKKARSWLRTAIRVAFEQISDER